MKRKVLYAIILLAFTTIVGIAIYNRINWGHIVPFFEPDRISFRGRCYYPRGLEKLQPAELKAINPSYYWGRGLYVLKEDYESHDVKHRYSTYTIIYLKGDDGEYSRYVLSGGP
ncbi:MAG TPA: hypothetical protein VE439_05040 [Anaerolineae bacterium]|jgi:hypothetical protein|nr:hypothetical protein [Anaerolineae bacterium]